MYGLVFTENKSRENSTVPVLSFSTDASSIDTCRNSLLK
ncbi:hypothetical protein CEXT_469021, partial [Caerostris extrusa]